MTGKPFIIFPGFQGFPGAVNYDHCDVRQLSRELSTEYITLVNSQDEEIGSFLHTILLHEHENDSLQFFLQESLPV